MLGDGWQGGVGVGGGRYSMLEISQSHLPPHLDSGWNLDLFLASAEVGVHFRQSSKPPLVWLHALFWRSRRTSLRSHQGMQCEERAAYWICYSSGAASGVEWVGSLWILSLNNWHFVLYVDSAATLVGKTSTRLFLRFLLGKSTGTRKAGPRHLSTGTGESLCEKFWLGVLSNSSGSHHGYFFF